VLFRSGGVLVSTHTGGVDSRDEFLSTGGVDTQTVGDELPGAIEGPAAVASRRGFPGPIAFRQVTTADPGAGAKEDRVDDLAMIDPLLTFRSIGVQQRSKRGPLGIGEFMTARHIDHDASVSPAPPPLPKNRP